MNRIKARNLVVDKIGDRRLIWLGIAGEDAGPLVGVPQLSNCYSVHSPLKAEGVESLAVESLTGWRRRDYDVSVFLNEQGRPMVESFTRAVSEPSLLLTHVPYEFLPLLLTAGQAEYPGNSYGTFQAVSDKHVIEAELRDREGISLIPWKRSPDDAARMDALRDEVRRGPVVLRSSRQDSGAGHELILREEQLESSAIAHLSEPISVAPYLSEYVPVCIGACVFADGGITLHTPSFQIIGIAACSRYDFGYCGNDFGAVKQLSRTAMERLEACVRTVGQWLHSKEFIGVFGVDAIVRDDEVVFVEINPRFLGSSRISAQVDAEMDLSDVYLDHLMACLGMPSHTSPSLADQAAMQPARSQLICHNLRPEVQTLHQGGMDLPVGFTAELVPDPSIRVGAGDLLFTLRAKESVTRDGKSIGEAAAAAIEAGLSAFLPSE